jgi:protein-serine/threonine kinase
VIETEKYIGIILDFANGKDSSNRTTFVTDISMCCSGGELFDHILAHRYLKEKDAAKLFAQLISGVNYLHQKKIVHRDLKLENLLLDKHRNVIITDFGFANRFEQKQDDLMSTSCGSPCYAAPELVISEGLYVGSAVDIWSCGVILYAMLSGYLPFDDDPANPDGDNINLLYRYIVNTPLTFPDYLSSNARDLLAGMLVPDPLNRCDIHAIMAHPWLSAYRPLFDRSESELEAIAQEQQTHKRAISRKAMQTRMRQQESIRVDRLAHQAFLPKDPPDSTARKEHSTSLFDLSVRILRGHVETSC